MKAYDLSELEFVLLEQNFFMQRLIGGILREFKISKFNVTADAESTVRYCRASNPDIILADWNPDMEALKFLKEMRQPENGEAGVLPIIVVSTYTEEKYVKRARDLGMNEFLALPLSAETLYHRLCLLIERPRPFIEAPDFFGPERRRAKRDFSGEDRRVSTKN